MNVTPWFAGPEACQPLGVLRWDPADGEAEAQCAAHVYQVLFCPLLPGWQCAGGRPVQLWDTAGGCIHGDVKVTLGLCLITYPVKLEP